MVGRDLSEVVRQLRRIVRPAGEIARTDAQLLERFSSRRDEAAFELLLARHGPMVLGLCQRLLRNTHDAEDAFQATFLVLVRKAGSLRERDLLANWLYGVAHRIAVRVQANNARRHAQERINTDRAAGAVDPTPAEQDLRWLLEEELSRLPNKYRQPVILCYLEGKSNEEAARHLRWPVGTVKGRLARARDLLRRRMTRRGVTLSSAALAAALSSNPVTALPPPLIVSTVRAAVGMAAGEAAALGGVSTSVLGLVQVSCRALSWARFKAVVLVLAVTALVPGAGLLVRQVAAPQGVNLKADLPPLMPSIPSLADTPRPLTETVALKGEYAEGKTFYQEIKTEAEQVIRTAKKKDVIQKHSQTLWVRCTSLGKKDGNFVLKLRIVGAKFHIEMGDVRLDYDSTAGNQPANALNNFLTALQGDEFTVFLNADATSTSYLKTVKIKGKEGLTQRPRLLDQKTNPLANSCVSEEDLQDLIHPLPGALPGRVVRKGDTWSTAQRKDLRGLGQYLTDYRYTYDGSRERLDRITVKTALSYARPRAGDQLGRWPFTIVKASLKSHEGKGVALFDRTRGRIAQATLDAREEGTFVIDVAGTVNEVDVVQTQRTSLRTSDVNLLP